MKSREAIERAYKKRNAKLRESRKDPAQRAKWILEDTKNSDKKRNLSFDLELEFISDLISHGCCYCGEMRIRMTLDRIDNTVGHIKTNVVPACARCNYLRGDMPYSAWFHLIPSVREAVKLGLFGDWTGGPHR